VTASTDNRFVFQGASIAQAVLVGRIEATDSDRKAALARFGLRYGVTNRLEVGARVSYVYRDDLVTGFELDDVDSTGIRDLEGSGLGDRPLSAQ